MNEAIEDFIPHRGPMRLVDRLVAADDEAASVEADVPSEGRFVRDGRMPAYVGIELMAQAVAAWAGARARRAGAAPRNGYLLGTRRFEASCAGFEAGCTLRIDVRCELIGDAGLGMFDCAIVQGGATLATARISVYEPREDAPAQIS